MTTIDLCVAAPRPEAPGMQVVEARAADHQPARAGWELPALGAATLLSAFFAWFGLGQNGYGNLYYASAVRSMMQSWHNFFFASFDPGGFVTVDKPPVSLWLQTISAKLFGFNTFALMLPQALATIACIPVLYWLVRRAFGPVAAILATFALAITPVTVVASRENIVDAELVLVVLLAACAVVLAAERGSLRWLLLSAVLLGVGYNVKMLEAYLVLPAFGLLYLLASPLRWRARIGHLVLAAVVLLVVSLSWTAIVDLTPAAARPYVGSSSTNSELELALGYNGIERLLGNFFRRGGATAPRAADIPAGAGGGLFANGPSGPFKLLDESLGGQVSWLLAFGLVGLFASGWAIHPRRLWENLRGWWAARRIPAVALDRRQAAFVLWGMWALTMGVFFSVASFFHPYYLVMMAPALAALFGIGAGALWHDFAGFGRRAWRAWLLPAALVVAALAQATILTPFAASYGWLTAVVLLVELAAAGALAWLLVDPAAATRLLGRLPLIGAGSASARLSGGAGERSGGLSWSRASGANAWNIRVRRPLEWDATWVQRQPGTVRWQAQLRQTRSHLRAWWVERHSAPTRLALVATTLGLLGLILGPLLWSAATVTHANQGTIPTAGPAPALAFGRPGGFAGGRGALGARRGFTGRAGGSGSGLPAGGLEDASVSRALVAYLEAHRGSARFLFATPSAMTAAPYIIQTGEPVMALGGFSGSDPILTLADLKALVKRGEVRYFLLGGFGAGGSRFGDLTPAQLDQLLAQLSPQQRDLLDQGRQVGPGGAFGRGNSALTSWVMKTCAVVPSSAYSAPNTKGSGGSGGAQLYDCARAAG